MTQVEQPANLDRWPYPEDAEQGRRQDRSSAPLTRHRAQGLDPTPYSVPPKTGRSRRKQSLTAPPFRNDLGVTIPRGIDTTSPENAPERDYSRHTRSNGSRHALGAISW